ncbi:MAG: CvpA family protein [Phreatobacter sp.]|uniref:CvpA family protein n=1 Tax=Phreatobacter sp. TaxID=1966341 RepID=UPI001A53F9AF|nr:CvpA family protein [Phreatobacter sp.]MBL8568338.1 CvpA family protein [Phreatobacter sp.]MCA0320140.1 CvpA family protein [Pseudomonadota bacterium]
MPVTYLDIGLAVIMLISALLAMVRGFVREVLSIASWGLAALTTWYAYPRLLPLAQTQVSNELLAKAIVIAGVFLTVLIVVSLITIRISDAILDSKIGVLDRTLGFLFGLARGLVIVVVAFAFFTWLVPGPNRPDWVTKAKSYAVLDQTKDWLIAQLPQDIEGSDILRRLNRSQTPPAAPGATPPATTPPAAGTPPATPPRQP